MLMCRFVGLLRGKEKPQKCEPGRDVPIPLWNQAGDS